jgi:hypothetical protein
MADPRLESIHQQRLYGVEHMTTKDEGWDEPKEPVHPILSAEQVAAAKKQARDKLQKERIAAAHAKLVEQETRRLQREEGLVIGGVADDMVTITLDLAPFQPNIVVNGHPYWHGQTYTVPRHVAASLQETQYRGWEYENREIDGKSMSTFYAKKHLAELYDVRKPGKVIGSKDL